MKDDLVKAETSRQIYIAEDILPGYVAVNKRVPLAVIGVSPERCGAVKERLISLYGAETPAKVTCGGKCVSVTLAELPARFESVELDAQKLTERKRFDFSDLNEIMASPSAKDSIFRTSTR